MINHNQLSLSSDEKLAASRVLASGWLAQGSEVAAFERELCRFFGIPDGHALVVSSGSAALYLALWVLDAKDARVGIPVYSCAALRNAAAMLGSKVVYLDCADASPNLDIKLAEHAGINILIAPSMFGIPVDLPEERDYLVIEDLAQAMGAEVDGNRIGLRGELGICSFYATKMMTSGGQGGAIVSRNKLLIDKLRDFRQFDCRDDTQIRFNFQMTDLQAAIGRVQLGKLDSFIEKRGKLFNIYLQNGLPLFDANKPLVSSSYYRAILQCTEADRVISSLREYKVQAINPIEEFELLDDPEYYPVARCLTKTTVSLPIYPTLHEQDAGFIAQIVNSKT